MRRLPVGYRFHPTDEELLVHYLKRKVFGIPLPASVIPEFDAFQTDPWFFPGDLKEKRYFFSKKGLGNGSKRVAAGSGYWKPRCKSSREIVDSASNQLVGMRKTLVFNHSCKTKAQWVMHEYSLNKAQMCNDKMRMGEWIVYSIFQRKRRPKRQVEVISNPKSKIAEVISQPSSPCSSGITEEEASYNGLDQEEISTTTSFNVFF